MTKEQHKEVIKQLVRYQVPRVLHEVFCQNEKKAPAEGEAVRLPHDMHNTRKVIWKKREDEADQRRDVELRQRKKFKDGIIRSNLANEFELTVYPTGFVRRPVISIQEDDVAWEPLTTATMSSSATTGTTPSEGTSEQGAGGRSTNE